MQEARTSAAAASSSFGDSCKLISWVHGFQAMTPYFDITHIIAHTLFAGYDTMF